VDNTGALLRDSSDDYLNGSPVQPGGSLTSKPTWPETFGFSATSAFFVLSTAPVRGCHMRMFASGPDLIKGSGRPWILS
jgi:hypothetical protein